MPQIPLLTDTNKWCVQDKKVCKEMQPGDGHTPGYRQWVGVYTTYIFEITVGTMFLMLLEPVNSTSIGMPSPIPLPTASLHEIPRSSQTKFTGFLVSEMTDAIRPHRETIAGGDPGNAFELWKVFVLKHEGGAHQCKLHGLKEFLSVPQCRGIRRVNAHAEECAKQRNTYVRGLALVQRDAALKNDERRAALHHKDIAQRLASTREHLPHAIQEQDVMAQPKAILINAVAQPPRPSSSGRCTPSGQRS